MTDVVSAKALQLCQPDERRRNSRTHTAVAEHAQRVELRLGELKCQRRLTELIGSPA